MKEITAEKVIKLFEPIPEKNWISHAFTDGINCCCAVGHFLRLTSENPHDYSRSNCNDFNHKSYKSNFRKWTEYICNTLSVSEPSLKNHDISTINNRQINGFDQLNPKARVMAFLNKAKEKGF